MKTLLYLIILSTMLISSEDYGSSWKEILKFEKKSLPKSALTEVSKIYEKAKYEKNEIQFIKALLYKEKYKLKVNEDGYVKIIEDIEKAIEESPKKGTKLILYSILAQIYEQYLNINYYKINHRTELKENSSNDIKRWSIEKLSKKSTELYLKSLDESAKDINIDEYRDILEEGKNSKEIQPTLYDFLAFRALNYFKNSRNGLNEMGSFTLNNPDAFASTYTFIYLSCDYKIKRHIEYQALRIYQELLKFHIDRDDKKVIEYIDAQRLHFVYQNFNYKNRDEYYTKSLLSTIEKNQSSEALLLLAEFYYQKGNYIEAIIYIDRARESSNRYIQNRAENMENSIRAKSIEIQTEEVTLPNENILSRVDYRNIKQLFVKVVKLDKKDRDKIKNKKSILKYIKRVAILKEFKIELPKTDDYKNHSTELSLGNYKLGEYLFIFSATEDIDKNLIYKIVTISNVSYIRNSKKIIVINRKSGEPIEGVEVSFYDKRYNRNTHSYESIYISKRNSNRDGEVDIPISKNNSLEIRFKYGKDRLVSSTNNYYDEYREDTYNGIAVKFFTDRAIYRPNQTIYFKGLAFKYSSINRPKILTDKEIKVSFYDTNHQLIESKTFTTNEFGTFNGEFTAPKSGLLGTMYIEADIGGRQSVQVEEYKRPKFEVTFKKLEKSYQIGDTITLKGEAKGYAGDKLDEAKVKYRVKRVASFPWISYWEEGRDKDIVEDIIASGELKTDNNGIFSIKFNALSDKNIDIKDRPNYRYTISVDVTDSTGETHSNSKSIILGYVGIKLSMEVDSEINSEENSSITINSTNLDDKFQPIMGTLLVEKFMDDKKIYRTRYWSKVDREIYNKEEFEKLFPNYRYGDELREKKIIKTIKFNTKENRKLKLGRLEQGKYLLTLKSYDKNGQEISISKEVTIYNLIAENPPTPTYIWHKNNQKEYKPLDIAKIYLKSSLKNLPTLLTIEREGKFTKKRWIRVEKLKEELIKISKKDRGNIYYQLDFVQNNRFFHIEDELVVPWDSRLKVKLVTFRDRLKPNEKEQWKIKISGEEKDAVVAEMVATMYDASLDQFISHSFSKNFHFPTFRQQYRNNWRGVTFNSTVSQSRWQKYQKEHLQRTFLHLKWSNFINQSRGYGGNIVPLPTMYMAIAPRDYYGNGGIVTQMVSDDKSHSSEDWIYSSSKEDKKIETAIINIRKNFNETIFFKPNLRTDKDGNILINFKTNEALTRWNFKAFVHSKELKTALIDKTLTTTKELMVVSNLPRFFREKDTITISAKVVNMSKKEIDGECELKLIDPITEKAIYKKKFKKYFHLKKGLSTNIEFKIKIPDSNKISAIKEILIARTATHTDAEEVIRPVLSNRVFITESKAILVKPNEEKSFTLESLKNSSSKTLKNHKLTLEFTSNPVWYAIASMPYLMEYEHECSEQLFSRYYANALAKKVMDEHPKIKTIFKEWRESGKLKSKLSTNQELKSLLLEETPWVLEAQSEEEQQKNMALLFDLDRLASQQKESLEKLDKRQLPNGGWSWFGGDKASWYITQYIVEGMGHLKKLGVSSLENNSSMLDKAIEYIDKEILNEYISLLQSIEKGDRKLEDDNLNSMIIHYLYARGLHNQILNKKVKNAYDYYLHQAKEFWSNKGIYEKGMIALTVHNLGEDSKDIVASIKEHSIHNELGTYFKYPNGYNWNQLPIETHSLMIELFETVTNDKEMVEELKTWLLNQKETNHWRTTKSTSSAIYALLLNSDWLEDNNLVEVSFNTKKAYQTKLKEAQNRAVKGLGYYKVSYSKDEFDKSMATLTIKNPNNHIAWGGVYWQYFEDMDRVKSFKETPLTIRKRLFYLSESPTGEKLIPLNQKMLNVGDRVKVRIEIGVARDMEYIMLKDSRASTFEPIDVISQYRYQDGLGYYQSTKDNATYFFIDYLPKGSYVFEYSLVVTHKGVFSNGITTIESIYAPKFKSHSEGIKVFVE